LIKLSGIQSRFVEPTVILLRRTTWKCGKVERVVINFLQKKSKQPGQIQSPVKEIMEHFESQNMQQSQLFEAMERLEKRNIIRVVFNPFSMAQGV
jgi:hypothetical protein